MSNTAHLVKNNFSSGEVSPNLDDRDDVSFVSNGCRVLENFIIKSGGGISRRPGTEFIASTEYDDFGNPNAYRLIPFKVSADENYVLEFGKNYIRPWSAGLFPTTPNTDQSEVPLYEFGKGYSSSERVRISYPSGYSLSLSSYDPNLILECISPFNAIDSDSISNNALSAILNNNFSTWRVVEPNTDNVTYSFNSQPFVNIDAGDLVSDVRIQLDASWSANLSSFSTTSAFWINPTTTNTVYQSQSASPTVKTINSVGYAALTALKSQIDSITTPNNIETILNPASSLKIFSGITDESSDFIVSFEEGNATPYATNITANIDFYADVGGGDWQPLTTLTQPDFTLDYYAVDVTTYSPYSNETDVNALQYVQLNDVMFLASENHPPQRLTKNPNGTWTLEEVPFQFAPVVDPNETSNTVQIQYDENDWTAPVWETGETYLVSDVVALSSAPLQFYVCKSEHTASATTQPNVGASWTTVWDLLTYSIGDRIVNDDGILFTCHTAHTPTNSLTNATGQPGKTTGNWKLYWNEGTSSVLINAWAAKRVYNVNDYVKSGKVIYRCIQKHKSIAPTKNNVFDGALASLNNVGNKPGIGRFWKRYWKVSGSEYSLSGLKFKLISGEEIFSSTDVNSTWQLKIGIPNYYIDQPLATVANDSEFGPSDQIFLQGTYIVSTSWNSGAAYVGNIILEESTDGETWTTVKEWTFTNSQENNINYTGSAPETGSWYRFRGYKTSGGQRSIKLERLDAFATIPFKIESLVSETEVRGAINLPNNLLPPARIMGVSTKLYYPAAFSETRGYPRGVSFYSGRLWWGGTTTEPLRLWGSKVDDFYNYLKGTLDDSSLDLTLASSETNEIVWLKTFNKSLVVGTTGSVWTVDSGDSDDPITPKSLRGKLRLNVGCAKVEPHLTGDSLLFVGRDLKTLREFSYRFEADAFSAPDLSIIANHIFRDSIANTAFQINPEPVWWGVSDGELVGLTYNREQNIVGWHRHITGLRDNRDDFTFRDKFVSVTSVYGSNNIDEMWFLVERRNGFKRIRYVERFSPQGYALVYTNKFYTALGSIGSFVDCHVVGSATNTVVGSNFIIRPDGEPRFSNLRCVKDLTVSGSNGKYNIPVLATALGDTDSSLPFGNTTTLGPTGVSIPLDSTNATLTATRFYVGVPYMSVVIPNKIEIPLQNGSSLGRKKRINRLNLSLKDSFDGEYIGLDGTLNTTVPLSVSNFEYRPFFDDSYSEIDYNKFTYTNHSAPNMIVENFYKHSFTGITDDQNVNFNWSIDPQYAIVCRNPTPFTLLNVVQKIEIAGN